MKKTILIGLICLLVISSAIAYYSSKEEARTGILNYIQTRKTVIDKAIPTITYTQKPDCEMREVGENIYDTCTVCFEFEYESKIIEGCNGVLGDMTDKEIDERIKETVKEIIKREYPQEEFKYERDGFLGREIQIINEK